MKVGFIGAGTVDYLTRWRITLAEHRMANSSMSVSEFAQSLGYESVSAFTKAFRRAVVYSPRQYRRLRITDVAAALHLLA